MSFADDIAGVLAELGEPVIISYGNTPEIDPVTGDEIGGGVPVEIDGVGYPGKYDNAEVDGTNIRSTDVRLTLSLRERPQVGWFATVDAITYRIQNVRPVRFSGEDIITICQLRAS